MLSPSLSQSVPQATVAYAEYTYRVRQDIIFTYQPVGAETTGYYSCRSQQSGYEAEVFVTITNPIWEQTSQVLQDAPLGAEVVISARYADSSFGYQNLGSGFSFELRFVPCAPTLPEGILDVGTVDLQSNLYEYTFRAGADTTGTYQLRGLSLCTHMC